MIISSSFLSSFHPLRRDQARPPAAFPALTPAVAARRMGDDAFDPDADPKVLIFPCPFPFVGAW